MVSGATTPAGFSQGLLLCLLPVALITLSGLALVPAACASPPIKIKDLEYIHQVYFFIADHPVRFDHSSLLVWRDDGNPFNNYGNTIRGRARLDPLEPTDSTGNPENVGSFDVLIPGEDYQVFYPYFPVGAAAGAVIPVIHLMTPLPQPGVLAVSYVERIGADSVMVGRTNQAEYDSALGKFPGEVLLRMIGPPMDMISITAGGEFDRRSPWYPSLRYQLKNFYRLGIQNFSLEDLTVTIRHADAAYPTDPESFQGVPFINLLGLDQHGPTVGSPPDGKIDGRFVDFAGGLLFFPDLHPFDPDTAAGNCAPGAAGLLCLDNIARNPLRECEDPLACIANPRVYKTKYPDLIIQYRFYIEVSLREPLAPRVLRQNRPNPFRSGTTIEFVASDAGLVRLAIHDIQGRLVKVLVSEVVAAGPHLFNWDGRSAAGRTVSSGVYVCRLEGTGFNLSRRMVLLR